LWKSFSLLTEVDPSAITLARPIDVLKPREMPLKFFSDRVDTGRHGAVVVSNKNEPQGVARRELRLFAHRRATFSTTAAAATPTRFQLESIKSRAVAVSRRASSHVAISEAR
jgi:hypothetical protein